MARLVAPIPGSTVYDPAAGSGILLRAVARTAAERFGDDAELEVHGQEIGPATRTLAELRLAHLGDRVHLRGGDTLRAPAFTSGRGLRRFDRVVANPMWDQRIPAEVWRCDPYGRCVHGLPPEASADWGWLSHVAASLAEGGRAVVVLSRSAVERTDPAELAIRRGLLEAGLLEGVVVATHHRGWPWCHPALLRWPLHHASLIVLSSGTGRRTVRLMDAGPLVRIGPSASVVDAVERAYRSAPSPGLSVDVPVADLVESGSLSPHEQVHPAVAAIQPGVSPAAASPGPGRPVTPRTGAERRPGGSGR